MSTPTIAVLGSINLDIVATAQQLPVAGETVTGATLSEHPGGKGANQALAARRLGADVSMIGRVGADSNAYSALALLRADGVDLTRVSVDETQATGVALICVDSAGENQIVVAPGANAGITPEHAGLPQCDALICQLEVPAQTIVDAAQHFDGFFVLNLAPARDVPNALFSEADLIIVNETEADFYGPELLAKSSGLIAITYGAKGAALFRRGEQLARALPPEIVATDATGAGDSFVAALTLALVRGDTPETALRFACCVGALTATRAGAQTSLPLLADVEAKLALD
jgi:ribokinase